MVTFDGWDIRRARAHLVFLVLLLAAGRGTVWWLSDRAPPPAPPSAPLPVTAAMSEKEKWVWGARMELARAGEEELMLIPGVGRDLARRIAAFVRSRGPGVRVDDLLAVRGVGEKRLAILLRYLESRPP
jgi:DNA uptake protein ComE-like DNA-binding protein